MTDDGRYRENTATRVPTHTESESALNDPATDKTIEHKLIDLIKGWTEERLIGDDCAILPGRGLVTADTLVEGTHFRLPDIGFADLGWKAMAVNLSDIAAMAGRPRYAVVSLTLPAGINISNFERLFRAMVECARVYRCRIVGGDLTSGPQLVINVTVIGDQHENGVMRRNGGAAGDVVVVTGDFGASAAGLWLMLNDLKGYSHCRIRHFRPLPRLCESWALVRKTGGRGALMDASDGLADALVQLSRASQIDMEITEISIPVHEQTRQAAAATNNSWLDWALYGGEDYELVGCIRSSDWQQLQSNPHNPFVVIGQALPGNGAVSLLQSDGCRVPITLAKTFKHWPGTN